MAKRVSAGGRGGRAVAFTFDDLPARGDLATMRETTNKLLRTLAAERIQATGFVNESKVAVGEVDERTALLTAWLDAGVDLGNHTYSHVSIDQVPFEMCKADLIKGEAVTRRLLEACCGQGHTRSSLWTKRWRLRRTGYRRCTPLAVCRGCIAGCWLRV